MGRRVFGTSLVVAVVSVLTVGGWSVTSGTVAGAVAPLSIVAKPLTGGFIGQTYSRTLAATGGNPPYRWKIAPGSAKPPKGLKLNKATGVISGTPNKHARTSTFTVEVLDTKVGTPKTQNTATATFTITIGIPYATAISAGSTHTCAVISGGTVDCWGDNSFGELGNGTTTSSSTPVQVSGLSGATAVAVGNAHTCALTAGGAVWCWGFNGQGELGIGTTTNSSIPVEVFTGTVNAIAAGAYHTCALIGGNVYCWGDNTYGQLGDGTTTSSSTVVAVSGLSGVTGIGAGWEHSCAVTSPPFNQVYCWGDNSNGQLGDGTTTSSLVPVQSQDSASAIAGGEAHTCVISGIVNEIDCWGNNGWGQLGDGTTTNSSTPVQVTGVGWATAITSGNAHSCALLAGGGVDCWGDNTYGQLGDGTTTSSNTPVAVSGLG